MRKPNNIRGMLFNRQIALPKDHGSWVFLLSPLLIGIFASGNLSISTTFLILASISVFLARQPISILVKIWSGRKSRRNLTSAIFWSVSYSCIALVGLSGLLLEGYNYLLLLTVPGVFVFAWHLWLISRRAERRKVGVEIIASGILALNAPAGYWVGVGKADPLGWILFFLTWFQSAASIVYAYLRLEQRSLSSVPDIRSRLSMGQRALLYTSFNLGFVLLLGLLNVIPILILIPYLIQSLETIWGTLNPAIGLKPTKIGLRQLIVSTIFTILFIVCW